MATTTDYLNKLVTQKNTLADNLVTKGVTATHDETLETLVPKVLEISVSESTKYITEGLIGYSNLSDDYTYNIVFDETLKRNVHYCDGTHGYLKPIGTTISKLTNNIISLQALCKTSDLRTWGEIIVVGKDKQNASISLGKTPEGYFAISYDGGAAITNIKINDDLWHMLTATYSDGVICAYVDGVCVGTYNNVINISSDSEIIIGQWYSGVSKFIGYTANACIYNRALTAEEVAYNYSVDNI